MDARVATLLSVLLADARRHKLVTATTLLGMAVGVAVVVGIHLSSQAALDRFGATHGGLVGAATHQLTGVAPLSAERLPALLACEAVEHVQPVVETTLVVPPTQDGEPPLALRVLGVDPFFSAPFLAWGPGAQGEPPADLTDAEREASGALFERLLTEPGLAVMDPAELAVLGLPDGGTLRARAPHGFVDLELVPAPRLWGGDGGAETGDGSPGGAGSDVDAPDIEASRADSGRARGEAAPAPRGPPRPATLGGTFVALMDLAAAQELLRLGDGVLRYDLILRRDADGAIDATTEALVPVAPGERLERSQRRGERADMITRAFRHNLLCLGFLAVLVGAFLVYNMGQFAVTRRRALLGKLRCLGAPASAVRRAVLLEAGVLGLLGGALGVLGGRALAAGMVGDVARTVSTLYGAIETPTPELDAVTVVGALGVAVVAAVGATWGPARSAAATPPVLVASGTVREAPAPLRTSLLFLLGGLVALAVPGTGVFGPALSVLLLLLAVATMLPHLLGAVVRHPPGGVVVSLAAGRVSRSLARTGGAAGALTMPIAMTIAIAVMIGSFQSEVSTWIGSILGGDVYAGPAWAEIAPEEAFLDPAVVAAMDALPGVEAVDVLRRTRLDQGGGSFFVAGSRLRVLQGRQGLRVLEGDAEAVFARLAAGEVIISQPLATRTGLGPGDELEVSAVGGTARLPVAAVFQDFSYDRGYAMLEESRFLELFGDAGVRAAAAVFAEGVDPREARDALAARFPDVVFTTAGEVREGVMEAFDQTFRITYVLQAISTALAWLGVLTALLCLHLERRAELGVLRALGTASRRVFGLMLTEAMILVAVAAAVAVPTGAALAWILVAVVNKRSFGWTFPMRMDGGDVVVVLACSVVAGVLAVLVPWAMARRQSVAELLEARE